MSLDAFYVYQLAWYVFATLAAFVAAWFFYDKGVPKNHAAAEVTVRGVPVLAGTKLAGAAGIFVAVLLVFHVINPLEQQDRLVLCYAPTAPGTIPAVSTGDCMVRFSDYPLLDLDPDNIAVELWPQPAESLRFDIAEGAFTTIRPIPPGKYAIRVIDSSTGDEKQLFTIPVPAPNQGGKS